MASPPFHKTSPTYMPYIDGLRAVAVLGVLLFHIGVAPFGGGFAGVDIFFVISGFLITGIITREIRAGQFSFAGFYARRIRRIFPALFAMLFLTSFAAVVFLGPHQFYEFFKALRMASGQVSNFFFSQEIDYFAPSQEFSPLLHTWSLGVEEQFYLVWPLLLVAVHKIWGLDRGLLALGAIFAVSLGLSEYLVRTDAMQAFYLLPGRAWELALGGIVALRPWPRIENRRIIDALSLAGLAAIAVPIMLYDEGHFPGLKALPPCLGAAMLMHTAQHGTGIGHRILSFRPLVMTGLISYSLYLWHWPVIAFYKGYFGANLTPGTQAAMIALSFALAALSTRYIEKPFRHGRNAPRRVLAAGLAVIIVFIIASNVIKNENDSGWRVTYDVIADVRSPHPLDKVCSIDGGAFNREDCIIGPHKAAYEVILVGDSHASHYTPAVLEWARTKGLTVRIFLRGACRTWVDSDDVRIKNGKVDDYCMTLTRAFYETLAQDASIHTVFLGLMSPDDSDEIRRSLRKIMATGKRTVFLGQVPMFREDPHECQIKNNLLISRWFPRRDHAGKECMTPDHAWSEEQIRPSHEKILPLLAEMDIPYFDPTPFMQAPVDAQGRFMYLDTNHMNRYGGLHLAGPLGAFMEKHPAGAKP